MNMIMTAIPLLTFIILILIVRVMLTFPWNQVDVVAIVVVHMRVPNDQTRSGMPRLDLLVG